MDPSLYVVLDRTAARGRDLVGLLAQALAGGSRMIQLRDKDWPSGRLLPLAEKLRAACAAAGATFIVNDRVDLALAVGADGVHLGQDDLPARAARPLLRPGMILGISTHSVEQARAAQADGADYVAVGSMFATTSKADFQLVGPTSCGNSGPRSAFPCRDRWITHENVSEVIRAGADGVAVISAVCAAADPQAAAARFLTHIRAARDLTPARPPL